ncbi:putative ornithine decarboxylase [Fusarium oxysporum f. sp. rapae]|uniref:Putative ornithine decarboxylase n=1 Tax=Fusarium oxysporum f. sp. rapae TaxID=485398 RepID=A0A8J5NSG0_FUSOX|nr:putative ornithine decarboxylase [Fusarium oxysporum f. sp. rapae]
MSPAIQDTPKWHKTQSDEESEKPVFVIDVAIVRENVNEFIGSWESTEKINVMHFIAVKACADKPLIDVYDGLKCNFDCASKGEAKPLLDRGVDAARISLGNCNLPANELKWCIKKDIQYYAVDSPLQVDHILKAAHMVAELEGSDKPFSTHFGVNTEVAFKIIEKAKSDGLTFVGLSGHPGTQNLAKDVFVQFAKLFRGVFDRVKGQLGSKMKLANIGGGWAGISTKDAPSFTDYNRTTMNAFSSAFADWDGKLTMMTEPGRALISRAGWLQTHVINISQPSLNTDLCTNPSRVYLSAGTHHGLKEGSKISFEWHTCHPPGTTGPCVLYGPTCDSDDINLGKDANGNEKTIDLPLELRVGEVVLIYRPAAFGPSYCTSFNGVPPPKVIYVNHEQSMIDRYLISSIPGIMRLLTALAKAYKRVARQSLCPTNN